jgi:hypothetical protein
MTLKIVSMDISSSSSINSFKPREFISRADRALEVISVRAALKPAFVSFEPVFSRYPFFSSVLTRVLMLPYRVVLYPLVLAICLCRS